MNDVAVVELDIENAMSFSVEKIREVIRDLEEKMRGMPQIEVPLTHYFSEGVYGREIRMAKGTFLVGKIHKFRAMNVLSQGEVTVLSIDGPMRFKAPHTFVSSPGAKRVIYAHEDAVWTNFHGTDETDVEKIEKHFIAENYDDIALIEEKPMIKTEET